MPYREDFDAALARAQATQEELDAARAENERDHERIAELEKELAEAKRGVSVAEKAAPAPPPPAPVAGPSFWSDRGNWVVLVPIVVVGFTIVSSLIHTSPAAPKPIDFEKERVRAEAAAREKVSDAVLAQEGATAIDRRGMVDLVKGFATWDFVSARGGPTTVHVAFMQGNGRREVLVFDNGAKSAVQDPPRCTAADVWAEAIRRGAPSSDLAEVKLESTSSGLEWHFWIRKKGFEITIPDACR